MKKASCVALGATWFGAAVSVAEIEAGIQSGGNVPALILGHVLGGMLLFAAGLIGAKANRNAMETATDAFGTWGGRFFAALNVLQLVGWTAVMVLQGAAVLRSLSGLALPYGCIALASLVAIWLFVVAQGRFHFATVAMALLAVLAVVLTVKLGALPETVGGGTTALPFWPAFEISIAMPLSWLPLISDYTREAKRPVAGTAVSAAVYTLVSIWMYALGILLVRSGSADLATGISKTGLGWIGLVIVAFSTVTTTFLDAHSSGESVKAIFAKASPQTVGVIVCALGAVLAISGIVDRYVDFLYLIASVFAPMTAVLVVSRFIVRRRLAVWNLVVWLIGTLTYHFAGSSPIGPTLTSLLVSGLLASVPLYSRSMKGK